MLIKQVSIITTKKKWSHDCLTSFLQNISSTAKCQPEHLQGLCAMLGSVSLSLFLKCWMFIDLTCSWVCSFKFDLWLYMCSIFLKTNVERILPFYSVVIKRGGVRALKAPPPPSTLCALQASDKKEEWYQKEKNRETERESSRWGWHNVHCSKTAAPQKQRVTFMSCHVTDAGSAHLFLDL